LNCNICVAGHSKASFTAYKHHYQKNPNSPADSLRSLPPVSVADSIIL